MCKRRLEDLLEDFVDLFIGNHLFEFIGIETNRLLHNRNIRYKDVLYVIFFSLKKYRQDFLAPDKRTLVARTYVKVLNF